MKSRTSIGAALGLASAVAVWAAVSQRQELSSLRLEQQRLLVESERSSGLGTAQPAEAAPPLGLAEAGTVPPELLRLRSEVARLSQQLRELQSVQQENDQLRSQLAASQTNGSVHKLLPPGYIRRTKAQLVGYNSPEDTLQTFLWALQNRSLTNLLQAFSPAMAEEMTASMARAGPDGFFRDSQALIGVGIVQRDQLPDGSLQLIVEVVPGMPPEPMRFELHNGQWKIASRL